MDIDLIRLVGCGITVYFLLNLLLKVRRIIYTHILATRFGDVKNLYGYGKWAVVTGSTDGIGKGYAKELARRKINIFLISRNAEKLEETKKDILSKSPDIEVRTLAFDFGTADLSAYSKIKEALNGLDVGVLVNNVGAGNEYPEKFLDHPEPERTWDRMLKVNCLSVTEMTFIVLPQMLAKKMGAIINIASASAFCPTPYLTVYAATKSFVSYFTNGLKNEYANSGVIIQCVFPYFVATNMSKIKRPSFFAPNADYYAKSALNTVGLESETTGCLSHSLQHLIYGFIPQFVYNYLSNKILLANREKYIKKTASKKDE